jgi:isocitrate lyase
MATQNRFKTGLDIAKYTAAIMRKIWQIMMQMLLITQSLGSWHGFVATKYIAVKKHHKTTIKDTFTCLDGWLLLCVLNLDHYLINPCTKKPQFQH